MSDRDYRAVFISESKEHIFEIFRALNEINKNSGIKEDIVFDLFRRFHTLKGMANTLGLFEIGKIAHLLEELLEYIRKNPESIFTFIEVIRRGLNTISIEIDNYEKGLSFASDEVVAELSRISKGIKERPGSENAGSQHIPSDKDELYGLYESIFEIDSKSRTPAVRAFMLLRELSSSVSIASSDPSYESLKKGIRPTRLRVYTKERIPDDLINEVLRKVGEIECVCSNLIKQKDEAKRVQFVKYVRIPFDKIEELTSSLDELLLLWNKYRYSFSEDNQNQMLLRLEYGFKKVIMYAERLRTVPASNIIPNLLAISESTSKALGKNVRLVIKNENIEIDKSIIDRLEEPLVHIIRNAIYHGIENQEERASKGKPPVGIIEIIFREAEEYIEITIRDDGRGMNRAKILEVAAEKGLLKKGAELLSDDEVFEMVFIPGFSTVREADMTSGRGFGMDIVRNVIWQMGGDIKIVSREGEGTSVIIRVPYQFASKKVVIGEIRGIKYAFPVSNSKSILRRNDVKVLEDEGAILKGNEVIRWFNKGYKNAELFIICSNDNESVAVGMDDIVFVGETRLYKVPYVLKNSKFISGMVVVKGVCPVPVISVEYLLSEKVL